MNLVQTLENIAFLSYNEIKKSLSALKKSYDFKFKIIGNKKILKAKLKKYLNLAIKQTKSIDLYFECLTRYITLSDCMIWDVIAIAKQGLSMKNTDILADKYNLIAFHDSYLDYKNFVVILESTK